MIHRSVDILVDFIFISVFGQQSLLVPSRALLFCWYWDLKCTHMAVLVVIVGGCCGKDFFHGQPL